MKEKVRKSQFNKSCIMSPQAHVGTDFIAIRTEMVCFSLLLQYYDAVCACNGTTGYFQGRVSMQ